MQLEVLKVLWVLLTAFMLGFYFYVLFKNGIDLNEITIEFSILYFCCYILIFLLTKIVQKGNVKKLATFAIALVVVMAGVISYVALTELPESKTSLQMELVTILGNSTQFKELGINNNNDIESITFHGAPRRGDFDQILGYVIELTVKDNENVYYFMCAGNGPYCSQFVQVEEAYALELIEHL